MDEYLIPNSSFKRLYEEYIKYGSLVVGVDFDSTIYDFHKKGATYNMVISLVRKMHQLGFKIIIWTAQNNLDLVKNYCYEKKIPYSGINTDGINLGWESRKPMFSCLLDDRAGLESTYRDLELLVWLEYKK